MLACCRTSCARAVSSWLPSLLALQVGLNCPDSPPSSTRYQKGCEVVGKGFWGHLGLEGPSHLT